VDFTNLIDFLAWEEMEKGGPILVYSLDYSLLWNVKDLIEKISFVVLSYDILRESLRNHNALLKIPFEERVKKAKEGYRDNKYRNDKYYFYNFIIYLKSSLDSVAVTINSFYGWDFRGGQIDLGKEQFITKFVSLKAFNNFRKEYLTWIKYVIDYRMSIIHQKSIDIFLTKNLKSKSIPLHPLSVVELDEILENYESLLNLHPKKPPKELMLINMNTLMKTCIDNLLAITGLLSTEILSELKKRYPNHKPNKRTYK